MGLIQQFSAYSNWRAELSKNIQSLRDWLQSAELGDAETDQRLLTLVERLRGDKLTVAFVAEFSRGKSELINALFFGDYGQRILPSSSGRTTMCPTELEYEPGKPAQIELLPIETRGTAGTVSEFKRVRQEWTVEPLDAESADAMHQTLQRVGEQKHVTREVAESLGFDLDDSGNNGLKPNPDGTVEIPAWRHAVINFPHPLLQQGLVVLDTPGLNAIGAEPELTLSLLPNAHAVLFILAADTGVTHSDLEVWRNHVLNASQRGRLVVLNKIDGLWDGLRSEADINIEIQKQVKTCASILEVDPAHVFPVSAQKALVGKIHHSDSLVARSRIGALEQALAVDIIPAKRQIVTESVRGEATDVAERVRELLDSRVSGLTDQLEELKDLRGKNQSVIRYMMLKVKAEKEEFEQSLQQYYAVRSVFTTLTNKLFQHLGMDALREDTRRTREAMLACTFSRGLKGAMAKFFTEVRTRMDRSVSEITEISAMLATMYKRFGVEHGLTLETPDSFSLAAYQLEIDRLESSFNTHFNMLAIITRERRSLTQQFFETVAAQVRRTFENLNRDIEHWLRAVMTPLESHVREHQSQLKRRLESVKRINEATDNLEDRIGELGESRSLLSAQLEDLLVIRDRMQDCLDVGSSKGDPADLAQAA